MLSTGWSPAPRRDPLQIGSGYATFRRLGGSPLRPISIVLAHLALFIGAASVSHACSVNYPETAFRCNPAGDDPRCPEGYICCSDDAAAIDLSAGTNNLDNAVLPAYTGGGGTGFGGTGFGGTGSTATGGGGTGFGGTGSTSTGVGGTGR